MGGALSEAVCPGASVQTMSIGIATMAVSISLAARG